MKKIWQKGISVVKQNKHGIHYTTIPLLFPTRMNNDNNFPMEGNIAFLFSDKRDNTVKLIRFYYSDFKENLNVDDFTPEMLMKQIDAEEALDINDQTKTD